MISNDERREIAERLRESREFISSLPKTTPEKNVFDTFELILTCIGYEAGNLFDYLAKLIDRPTATATMDYEAMEDGIPDCRIWTCNECKESFPVYRGFCPTYCPVCGMEIKK